MTYTYIEGNQRHTSGPNGPIDRVVIHATVSPCHHGGARENAHYFQSAKAGGLAHFVVDPDEVIQCAREDVATWHAPPNHNSLGVELCDPQAGKSERWADHDHEAMLHRAASVVADLCKRHGLPTTYVDAAGLKAGKRGVTTHHQVSLAWGQSSHTDPDKAGPFPLRHFLALVEEAAHPKPKAPKPVAHPKPHPEPYHYPRTIRPGMHGQDVRHMQGRLGFAHPDGDYGPKTGEALKKWQRAHGLDDDGVLGPKSQAKLG